MAIAEQYIAVRAGLDAKHRDPLSWWRFGVPRLREAIALYSSVEPIDELHLRACSKGTKTETEAAFVLACLQKRKELDGVPLPQWRGPVEAAQLVLDFKVQLLSVQAAYLRLLGGWPHHARYTGEILSSLRVKPVGASDNEAEWSVLHFLSQENRGSGVGARADIAAFDEPPAIEILREMRKAPHAGRRGIRLIAETPTIRKQWAPLREDYGETPRRTLRRVDQDRAECRWSLDEVADWILSPEEKAKLRRAYAKDPLRDAREHGDYTNTEGVCPFDPEFTVLPLMLAECRDPEMKTWRVSRETSEAGGANPVSTVDVEVWQPPKPGKTYYLPIDPASGVEGHNPAGLHVVEMGTCDLAARWNGYLAPNSLGRLAAGLARQYHNAQVDVEMKDHWGVNVVRGLNDSGYGNLCYEQRELQPGVWAKEVGFDQNEETRAALIGCVQEWIDAWRAGIKYAACPSRAVIECLMDCRLDERGKIVAGPGAAHAEDLICWGQSLRRALSRAAMRQPDLLRKPRTADDKLADLIAGRESDDSEDEAPFGQVAVKAKRRPRG